MNKYLPIHTIPKRIFRKLCGINFTTWFINFMFQRILRINSHVPFQVHFTSQVIRGDLKIGKNVWKSFALSGNCYIQPGNGITIGDNTIFGPGVKIISANHNLDNLKEWKYCSPIIIGKNCWIGANAVVLPEVQLGDNVIVGAGSVVTKSFEGNVVIAGNPAKIIKAFSKG